MTSEYIAKALNSLPRFMVESIDREPGHSEHGLLITGSISETLPEESHSVGLFFPDLDYLDGYIQEESKAIDRRMVDVSPWPIYGSSVQVQQGDILPMFPYDRRRLLLTIDPAIQWTKIYYQPRKALKEHVTGTNGAPLIKIIPYSGGDPIPDGAWIEEGSWDHEHCIFCLDTIDTEHIEHHAELQDEWACSWCYDNAVRPHEPRAFWTPYKDRK